MPYDHSEYDKIRLLICGLFYFALYYLEKTIVIIFIEEIRMRHEYCEKNGIIITYSDSDVAFEERETALSILISNNGSILHNNFADDPEKTQRFLEDFHRIYSTVCYFRSLDQMGDAV